MSRHPGKIMTTDVFGRFLISFNTITINLAHACLWGLQYPFKNTEQFKKGRCFALRFWLRIPHINHISAAWQIRLLGSCSSTHPMRRINKKTSNSCSLYLSADKIWWLLDLDIKFVLAKYYNVKGRAAYISERSRNSK